MLKEISFKRTCADLLVGCQSALHIFAYRGFEKEMNWSDLPVIMLYEFGLQHVVTELQERWQIRVESFDE